MPSSPVSPIRKSPFTPLFQRGKEGDLAFRLSPFAFRLSPFAFSLQPSFNAFFTASTVSALESEVKFFSNPSFS